MTFQKNQTIRNSNVELLRIVAILMVITLHFFWWSIGGGFSDVKKYSFNYYIAYFAESISIIAVNLFVIASAYFLSVKSKPKISKVIRLSTTAYFYWGGFFLLAVFLGISKFSVHAVIKNINFQLVGGCWYVRTYIMLYLLSPFINIIIDHSSKKMHQGLVVISLLFFSVWATFFSDPPNNDSGYGIISFVLLYLIVSYVRKYNFTFKHDFIVYVVSLGIVFINMVHPIIQSSFSYNFLFNIIAALAIFFMFLKLNFKSRIVNYIATFSFYIYVIQLSPYFIKYVFHGVLNIPRYCHSHYFILYLIMSILIIYCIAFVIELIRRCVLFVLSIIFRPIVKAYHKFEKFIDMKSSMYFSNSIVT